MSESSTYQQIRSHLAYLRLGAAAEALPGRARPRPTREARPLRVLGPPARGRGHRHRDPTPGRARALRLPAVAVDARGLRLQRPALGRQEADERARRRCASSRTPPTCCSSGRPASARPCWPSGWPGRRSTPAIGPTTRRRPIWPLVVTAPPSRDAGPPPCASSPDRDCLVIDEVGYLPLQSRSGRRAVPGHHPALSEELHRHDDQPRRQLVGEDLRRPDGGRRHAGSPPAPQRRVQHRRRELPDALASRPAPKRLRKGVSKVKE